MKFSQRLDTCRYKYMDLKNKLGTEILPVQECTSWSFIP